MHETERRVEAMMAAIAAEYQRELSERPVNPSPSQEGITVEKLRRAMSLLPPLPSGPGVGTQVRLDWHCDDVVRREVG